MPLYLHKQAADLLGVHPRTIGKVIAKHLAKTGQLPPGVDEHRYLDDVFLSWFNGREGANPRMRGKLGGGEPALRVTAPHVPAQVSGLTPASRVPDGDELWKRMLDMQARDAVKTESRYDQKVEIPDSKPALLVLVSDCHLGNRHTDYARARADAELIRDTPGVYGAILGDLVDSWINPKLLGLQRESPVPYADELALMESWLSMMAPKLVAVVSGNHDLRTYEQAGLDLLQRALANVRTLYDQHEIRFRMTLGPASWRWKLRHAWPRRSQYNETHGPEFDAKFNDGEWDIAVGGHTHAPTVLREFYDHAYDHKLKLAVQLGSYELDSALGRKLGLSRPVPGGSVGLNLWPDGRWQGWHSLEAATRFLAMERAR
jgi:predicted phosphodiesterase